MTIRYALGQLRADGNTHDARWSYLAFILEQFALALGIDLDHESEG